MSWDRPNYAIPGLMPESSPVYEATMRINPDGTPYEEHRMDPVLHGDWWEGESFNVTYEGGSPGTLAAVRIVLRKGSLEGDAGAEWSADNGLTITDDGAESGIWSFELTAHNIALEPGDWWGDVECVNTDGQVYTPFTIVLPVLFNGTA